MQEIYQAVKSEDIGIIRELFVDYAQSLGFSLCFQGFDKELERLPGEYAPPEGRLLLAEYDGRVAGCIALKKVEIPGVAKACEMKRLYVRPEFRTFGIGRTLAEKLIGEARTIGYERMVLDTVPSKMPAAVALYRSVGFVERTPYYANPLEEVLYMELELQRATNQQ
jgi:putative acetyltransferase